jgi:glucose-1-phosphatase
MPHAPRFIYFDLGNVLLAFSHEQAAAQMARVSQCDPALVWDVVFGAQGLEYAYETGLLSSEQFFQRFCELTHSHPNYDELLLAGSAIFRPVTGTIALVARLQAAGHRLGVLSNTCEAHWNYCCQHYPCLGRSFELFCLSYEVRAMKPHPAIYTRAIEMAECQANEIFFCDDRPENVQAALQAGIDAVLFTQPAQLVRDLMARGVLFNY